MKRRYLVGIIILVLVAGYLFYLSFGSSVSYYLTVSEFSARSAEFHNTTVRVAGKVADTPIDWNARDLELRFNIVEGGQTLPVTYHGAEPGGFQAGSDILVEGKYSSENVFQANQLIMKCPSKYEIKE